VALRSGAVLLLRAMWDDAVWPTVCVVTPQSGSGAPDYSQLPSLRAVVGKGRPARGPARQAPVRWSRRENLSNRPMGISEPGLCFYPNGLAPGGCGDNRLRGVPTTSGLRLSRERVSGSLLVPLGLDGRL
jgi:hypothetical protein